MVIFLLQIPYVRRIYLQMYGSGQPYLYVPLFLSYHLLTSYHNVPVAHCIPTHNRSAVCYICTQELAQISVRLVCWSKSGTSYSRNALDHFISRTLSLAHTHSLTYKLPLTHFLLTQTVSSIQVTHATVAQASNGTTQE
jgi:hypothetical protein